MGMNKTCKTCAYHESFNWVCFNGDSEWCADFTNDDFTCKEWEMKEDAGRNEKPESSKGK